MRTSLLICLYVCLLLLGALAQYRNSSAAAPTPLTVSDTVRLAAYGGLDIELRDTNLETKRLTFAIRGPEVTRLPKRAPITFHFDVPVKQATLLETSPALRSETVSAGSLVTCDLKRDPFSPPVPWHVTVQIELDALPRAGRIVVSNQAEQHMIY